MHPKRIAIVVVVLASLVAACSSTVNGSDGGSDSATGDGLALDVAVGSDVPPVSDSAVQCGTGTNTFPTFASACASSSDCALAFHQTDCCGSLEAIGLDRSQLPAFQSAEMVCDAMYPGCGCASNAITDGRGNTTHAGPGAVFVECQGTSCLPQIRATTMCGSATCSETQVCVPGCCGVPGCTPPPARCVDVPSTCAMNPGCGCFATNPCPTGSCVSFDGQQIVCICA